MKELDQLTAERLQAFIDNPLDNGFTRGEQMSLARVALAAKVAEPIAEVRLGDYDDDGWHSDAAPHILIDGPGWANFPEGFKLYGSPVLNSPEIPDGWVMVPLCPDENMIQAWRKDMSQSYAGEHAEEIGEDEVCFAYQAMLAAAPKPEK